MNGQTLVLCVGLPGSGKTTLSTQLGRLLSAEVITTEAVRAHLWQKRNEGDRDFTPDELELTYRAVELLIEYLLRCGATLVIDGVFRTAKQRQSVTRLATARNIPFVGLHVTCSEAIALRRLRLRKRAGSLAPSGPESYLRLAQEFQVVPDDYQWIDTSDLDIHAYLDIATSIARIVKTMR